MVERKFDFGFAVDWMRKDLGICLEEAKRNGAKLPVTADRRPVLRRRAEGRRQPLGHVLAHHATLSRADPMDLKLYYAPGACSFASHIVLEELGFPYETQKLNLAEGDQRKPEYLKLNPRGRVPTLRGRRQGAHGERGHPHVPRRRLPRRACGRRRPGTRRRRSRSWRGCPTPSTPPTRTSCRPERYVRRRRRADAIKAGRRKTFGDYLQGDRPPARREASGRSATSTRWSTPTCWCSTAGPTATASR